MWKLFIPWWAASTSRAAAVNVFDLRFSGTKSKPLTGGLLFALSPIQRMAERFTDGAMPSVQDTPEYRRFRKLEVYGEAYADTCRRGGPTPPQRVALSHLRVELGLSEEDVNEIEAELRATLAS